MTPSFQARCLLLCSVLVAGLSLLSGRLVQIQLVDRQVYAASSRKAFDRKETLVAVRGMIVDRNEEPIAKSIPVSTLYVDKIHLNDPKLASYALAFLQARETDGWEDLDPTAQRRRIQVLRGEILEAEPPEVIVRKHLAYATSVLSGPLRIRREELRARIETTKGTWIPIAREIDGDVAESLRTIIDEAWLQGFGFKNSIKRWYHAPDLATHLTGLFGEIEETDKNGVKTSRLTGQFGVEAAMEEFLAGRDGWREFRRDQRGLLIPGDSGSLLPPRSGLHVQLTIDLGLQAIVEEELDAALDKYKAEVGSVILMDPKTGDILAMASRPHFDLNLRDNIDLAQFNFALQGTYEPGSTFKVVAASGAMDQGLVRPQTVIHCNWGKLVEGRLIVPDHASFGDLTVEEILAKSSNIGAYKLARQLGTQRFYDYASRFGFGTKSGILLSGENAGILRTSGPNGTAVNPVDFSRASFGYALTVTPLQMASAYCAIANDGRRMKPRLVHALVHSDGTIVEDYRPQVAGEVMKASTAKLMLAALETATHEHGTATAAAVDGFRVAGKTGTAKKANPKTKGYHDNRFTVSFAGMMPAQDPRFVCVVVIDDPRTTEIKPGGGTMAAPTFSAIATRVAARMNLQPTEPVTNPLATAAAQ